MGGVLTTCPKGGPISVAFIIAFDLESKLSKTESRTNFILYPRRTGEIVDGDGPAARLQ